MLKIVGKQMFKAKDNSGNYYTSLHLIDDEPIPKDKGEGNTVQSVFVPLDCEIDGELNVGNYVRIFKEGSGNFNKVTYIKVLNVTKQK